MSSSIKKEPKRSFRDSKLNKEIQNLISNSKRSEINKLNVTIEKTLDLSKKINSFDTETKEIQDEIKSQYISNLKSLLEKERALRENELKNKIKSQEKTKTDVINAAKISEAFYKEQNEKYFQQLQKTESMKQIKPSQTKVIKKIESLKFKDSNFNVSEAKEYFKQKSSPNKAETSTEYFNQKLGLGSAVWGSKYVLQGDPPYLRQKKIHIVPNSIKYDARSKKLQLNILRGWQYFDTYGDEINLYINKFCQTFTENYSEKIRKRICGKDENNCSKTEFEDFFLKLSKNVFSSLPFERHNISSNAKKRITDGLKKWKNITDLNLDEILNKAEEEIETYMEKIKDILDEMKEEEEKHIEDQLTITIDEKDSPIFDISNLSDQEIQKRLEMIESSTSSFEEILKSPSSSTSFFEFIDVIESEIKKIDYILKNTENEEEIINQIKSSQLKN